MTYDDIQRLYAERLSAMPAYSADPEMSAQQFTAGRAAYNEVTLPDGRVVTIQPDGTFMFQNRTGDRTMDVTRWSADAPEGATSTEEYTPNDWKRSALGALAILAGGPALGMAGNYLAGLGGLPTAGTGAGAGAGAGAAAPAAVVPAAAVPAAVPPAAASSSLLSSLAATTGLSEAVLGRLLAGGAGALLSRAGSKPTGAPSAGAAQGYQGTIPEYKLTRTYNEPPAGRRPGSGGGHRYFTDTYTKLAQGGIAALPPREVAGPGDGMSDSIPAHIDGRKPAALADGEFVIPADVVSHLGNGSSKAGVRRLYQMMDRIRQARTGSTEQAPAVNVNKYMPG